MASELEMMFEIWSDDDYHFEVGPDRDGLECIEIRYFEGQDTTPIDVMTFNKEDSENLYKALGKLLNKQ